MVDETQSSVAFWDSLHFLTSYKTLSVEYLERIIRRELDMHIVSGDIDKPVIDV